MGLLKPVDHGLHLGRWCSLSRHDFPSQTGKSRCQRRGNPQVVVERPRRQLLLGQAGASGARAVGLARVDAVVGTEKLGHGLAAVVGIDRIHSEHSQRHLVGPARFQVNRGECASGWRRNLEQHWTVEREGHGMRKRDDLDVLFDGSVHGGFAAVRWIDFEGVGDKVGPAEIHGRLGCRKLGARLVLARTQPLPLVVGVVDGAAPIERRDDPAAVIVVRDGGDGRNLRTQNDGLVVGGDHPVHAQLDLVGEPSDADGTAHSAQDEAQAHARHHGKDHRRSQEHQQRDSAGGGQEGRADHPARVEHAGGRDLLGLGFAGVADDVVLLDLAAQVEEHQGPGGKQDVEAETHDEDHAGGQPSGGQHDQER